MDPYDDSENLDNSSDSLDEILPALYPEGSQAAVAVTQAFRYVRAARISLSLAEALYQSPYAEDILMAADLAADSRRLQTWAGACLTVGGLGDDGGLHAVLGLPWLGEDPQYGEK